MRTFIISATVATVAALSFAAPSQAGYYGGYYGGHDQAYCFIKKVRFYDYYGNLRVKRIRVCH
ncbi:hypothetical protein LXM94_03200 [Rhizobium sp. TRM95111]|uniref:hypothetical protein n=1 Tax=Rhizobium alarense TaxID=2846851 RepID=UPI001F1E171A|nr:hypothetical protein [Rhizobium alarense]MCF3638971.1 hypothetical protein [Rhizobium alarense]